MDYLIQKFQKIITDFGLNEFNYVQFLSVIGAVLFVFIIEGLVVGWEACSLKKLTRINRSAITDVISTLLEAFNLFQFLAFICCLGIFFKFTGIIQQEFHFKLIGSIPNEYVQFGLVFILGDLKSYIRHLIFHRVNFLWELHAFHHSATSFNVVTRYRGHFLEASFAALFEFFPFILLGVPLHTYLLFKLITESHQLMLHSEIRSDWGFIGRYILVSPACHRLHHSIETRHFNKNLGISLIVWDRIFGTYLAPERVDRLGVEASQHNQKGYLYDIWISAKRSFLAFFSLLGKAIGLKSKTR